MVSAVTDAEVTVRRAALEPARSADLDRQLAAERTIVRAIVHGILLALPLTIAFTIGLTAIAISDQAAWYVWIGLGAGIGAYAAVFFGSVAGVMLTSHLLDELDEEDLHRRTAHPGREEGRS
jgi:hypothetical protein